jgi:hypothetical protein
MVVLPRSSPSSVGPAHGRDCTAPAGSADRHGATTIGFALLMTWWPSRGAARVPIAEALRYE